VERGEELEEQSFLSTTVCLLAQALYALERLEEADAWAGSQGTMWICFVSLAHAAVQAVALATASPSCQPSKNAKTGTASFCCLPVHWPLVNPLPLVVEPNPDGCWTLTETE
jgi:hypothetical protein